VRSCNVEKRETARLMRDMGKSYREIAADLGVCEKTVRNRCRPAD
jgi:DNA-directed RNA polymerase specialized sigma24 family protein